MIIRKLTVLLSLALTFANNGAALMAQTPTTGEAFLKLMPAS